MKTVTTDRRVILSTLWIFAVLNYAYADVFNLYFDPVLRKEFTQQFLAGQIGSIRITQGFVLAFAVVIETAIAMVLLSRLLPYVANRWANVGVGLLQTASVVFSLTGEAPTVFYAMFAAIEIACTLFIVWFAWTWPTPRPAGVRSGSDAAQLTGIGFEKGR